MEHAPADSDPLFNPPNPPYQGGVRAARLCSSPEREASLKRDKGRPGGVSQWYFSSTLLAVTTLSLAIPAHAAPPLPERQRELIHLVRQDCGSCHGMTLKGGLGPSLKPDALRDKPPEALVATIYGGRPGTPMPPWHRFLSEEEAGWVVEQLLNGFPE